MNIKKFHIYTANLDPRIGTEPGKIRPVIVVQTDLLNKVHPSTIICPITSNIIMEASILRVHLSKSEAGLLKNSDILVDQIRAIDNHRFIDHLGEIDKEHKKELIQNLKIILCE